MSSSSTYELLYHPNTPGRGEYIRLVFAATGTPYTDVSNASSSGPATVYSLLSPDSASASSPPIFAPPALRVRSASGEELVISQTANILQFLGSRLGLAPAHEAGQLHALQTTLTALDLSDAAHDSHHPLAVSDYYEQQREAALLKSRDLRDNRIPKFFAHFEAVLRSNSAGQGRFLVGDSISYADTTLWQVLDGLSFAFPREMEARRAEFPALFAFYHGLPEANEKLKAYITSGKRLKFGNGIFRNYPELDRP